MQYHGVHTGACGRISNAALAEATGTVRISLEDAGGGRFISINRTPNIYLYVSCHLELTGNVFLLVHRTAAGNRRTLLANSV